MKNLLILLAIISLSSCTINSKTEYLNSDEKVALKVTPNTTKEELITISEELLEDRNISLDFQSSEFDKDGMIKNLNLKVDCNDGFKGSTKAEYTSLLVNKFGFVRDYSKQSKTPMKVGTIN